ncbi:hypothetical protein M231_02525 [Tremella mesenterica]|uniref:Uncharacterized protein n=2 Tax=Tremella mesenterica TaxID=5217 RepID=A0A4Q1BQN0_TREME|nr:hypothetical protein M231_02525 [Tremella mesenterica]
MIPCSKPKWTSSPFKILSIPSVQEGIRRHLSFLRIPPTSGKLPSNSSIYLSTNLTKPHRVSFIPGQLPLPRISPTPSESSARYQGNPFRSKLSPPLTSPLKSPRTLHPSPNGKATLNSSSLFTRLTQLLQSTHPPPPTVILSHLLEQRTQITLETGKMALIYAQQMGDKMTVKEIWDLLERLRLVPISSRHESPNYLLEHLEELLSDQVDEGIQVSELENSGALEETLAETDFDNISDYEGGDQGTDNEEIEGYSEQGESEELEEMGEDEGLEDEVYKEGSGEDEVDKEGLGEDGEGANTWMRVKGKRNFWAEFVYSPLDQLPENYTGRQVVRYVHGLLLSGHDIPFEEALNLISTVPGNSSPLSLLSHQQTLPSAQAIPTDHLVQERSSSSNLPTKDVTTIPKQHLVLDKIRKIPSSVEGRISDDSDMLGMLHVYLASYDGHWSRSSPFKLLSEMLLRYPEMKPTTQTLHLMILASSPMVRLEYRLSAGGDESTSTLDSDPTKNISDFEIQSNEDPTSISIVKRHLCTLFATPETTKTTTNFAESSCPQESTTNISSSTSQVLTDPCDPNTSQINISSPGTIESTTYSSHSTQSHPIQSSTHDLSQLSSYDLHNPSTHNFLSDLSSIPPTSSHIIHLIELFQRTWSLSPSQETWRHLAHLSLLVNSTELGQMAWNGWWNRHWNIVRIAAKSAIATKTPTNSLPILPREGSDLAIHNQSANWVGKDGLRKKRDVPECQKGQENGKKRFSGRRIIGSDVMERKARSKEEKEEKVKLFSLRHTKAKRGLKMMREIQGMDWSRPEEDELCWFRWMDGR